MGTRVFSVGAGLALSLGATFPPDVPAPPSPVPGKPVETKVVGPTCPSPHSWEASFKEMAAENEDWSDFDSATCDGLNALLEEEMMPA